MTDKCDVTGGDDAEVDICGAGVVGDDEKEYPSFSGTPMGDVNVGMSDVVEDGCDVLSCQ